MSDIRLLERRGMISNMLFTREVRRIGEVGRWSVLEYANAPFGTPFCLETEHWHLLPLKGE